MTSLLIDQGLPRGAAALMREAGYDAVHVGEAGMALASDREILLRARDERQTIVTLDGDFHALLAQSQALLPSVIRIRIEGLKRYECARLLELILPALEDDLDAGAVVTVQPGRVRVRRLPLGSE